MFVIFFKQYHVFPFPDTDAVFITQQNDDDEKFYDQAKNAYIRLFWHCDRSLHRYSAEKLSSSRNRQAMQYETQQSKDAL